MNRNIPENIRRQLREEVGFGCPVEDCGSPYLMYHHFDPPWRDGQTHDPAGMVALCREHHDKAEGGAFTADQMRAMKIEGKARNERIAGRFEWRRRQLLVHIGGTLTFETKVPLAFNGIPVVSLTRDGNNDLLLSVNMLTSSVMPRWRMFENEWVSAGTPTDFESPPFGRILRATYANGDRLSIEFVSLKNRDELAARLPDVKQAKSWAEDLERPESGCSAGPLKFPAVLVDIEMELPDATVSITSDGIKTGTSTCGSNCGAECFGAVSLGHIKAPYPTMSNKIGIAVNPTELRFASMNSQYLYEVSNRTFRGMPFILDGFDFKSCTFESCWFMLRGQRFGMSRSAK